MNLTPARRHAIRRWNAANARARAAYEADPSAGARTAGGACDMPYCNRPRHRQGLCARHSRLAERGRGETGAA